MLRTRRARRGRCSVALDAGARRRRAARPAVVNGTKPVFSTRIVVRRRRVQLERLDRRDAALLAADRDRRAGLARDDVDHAEPQEVARRQQPRQVLVELRVARLARRAASESATRAADRVRSLTSIRCIVRITSPSSLTPTRITSAAPTFVPIFATHSASPAHLHDHLIEVLAVASRASDRGRARASEVCLRERRDDPRARCRAAPTTPARYSSTDDLALRIRIARAPERLPRATIATTTSQRHHRAPNSAPTESGM